MSWRHRVLVPDATVPTLRHKLAATVVMEVTTCRALGVSLSVVVRRRSRRAGLVNAPTAFCIG